MWERVSTKTLRHRMHRVFKTKKVIVIGEEKARDSGRSISQRGGYARPDHISPCKFWILF